MSYEYRDTEDIEQYDIENRIRSWCVATMGIETIMAYPGAPRPPLPYAMINMMSAGRDHEMGPVWYEPVMVGNPPIERMIERRAEDWTWNFSIHIYGLKAMDRARIFTNSIRADGVWIDYLAPLDVREVSLIRRIPELIDESWEERVNFDLTLSGVVYDGFLIDVIESGEITIARKVGRISAVGKDVTMTYAKPTT